MRRPHAVNRWAARRLHDLLHRAAVVLLGDDGRPVPPARLATGIAPLDDLLGGGLLRGRLMELSGPPSGGKTGLALRMIAGVQRRGGTAAFIDVEGSLDPERAQRVGVQLARLAAARPGHGEEALQIVDALLRARAADIVVVDSVAALVPRAELLAPLGEAPIGLHARLLSQALRRIVASAANTGASVVFLNQQRTTFDESGKALMTTTGGSALHFYAATRLEVRRRLNDGALLVRVLKDRSGGEGRAAELL
jgi:recombination protein RecA